MVRVIAGDARGRKLNTLDKETTKPTLDRVKEAMFSMLTPYLEGAGVLDLFSGNGALGIEALSRGAAHCDFNDCAQECVQIIRANVGIVKYEDRATVTMKDFGEFIAGAARKGAKYDIVLMDPPYNKGLEREAMRLMSDKLEGRIIAMVEHAADDVLEDEIYKFKKVKDKKYGTVALTIFVKEEEK